MVLFLYELGQVFGLVVGSKYENDPFHRAYNPLTAYPLELVLRLTFHSVDCILKWDESVLLHFLVPLLGVPHSSSFLLGSLRIKILKIVSEVLPIHLFHHSVHLLLLKHNHVLHIVTQALLTVVSCLFPHLKIRPHFSFIHKSILQDFEAVSILRFKTLKDHLGQLHTHSQSFLIRKGLCIDYNLDPFLFQIVSR